MGSEVIICNAVVGGAIFVSAPEVRVLIIVMGSPEVRLVA